MTHLADKQAAEALLHAIEEVRAERAEGTITVRVSQEGWPVSIRVEKVRALPRPA